MRKVFGVSVLLIAAVNTAYADSEFVDKARVISVAPQVQQVNQPRQECRTEYVRESVYESNRSNSGAVVGGVAGGLLGSTIGRGAGRVAAAAVGAGIGAIVGDRVGNQGSYGGERVVTRPVDRCVTVDNWQTVTTGYLVQYEYQGRQYSTMMDRDPGQTLDVSVMVRPSYGAAPMPGVQAPVVWNEPPYAGRHRRDYW